MLNKIITIFFLIILLNPAEGNARRKKVKKKGSVIHKELVKPPVQTSKPLLLCYSPIEWPSWYLTSIVGFQIPPNHVKPANYKLLKVDEVAMINYLKNAPYDSSKFEIVAPLYMDGTMQCKEFIVERVRTMNDELQAKYPELMSFRAYEKSNPLNTGRIDLDGVSTKFMFTYNGKIYFISPLTYNQEKLYMAYAKNDPNFIKKSFEK
jgi:hypothetical protein